MGTKTVERKIRWKDNETENLVVFGIGDFDEVIDENVFYWVEEESDLKSLENENGVEEFYIID